MVDSERGSGVPTARSRPGVLSIVRAFRRGRVELAIAMSGARLDQGELERALGSSRSRSSTPIARSSGARRSSPHVPPCSRSSGETTKPSNGHGVPRSPPRRSMRGRRNEVIFIEEIDLDDDVALDDERDANVPEASDRLAPRAELEPTEDLVAGGDAPSSEQ